MRGRATGVVLSALAVLALVGVVAVASTGSTPGSSGRTRPPSDSFLDTLFSLGLVAIVLGAGILAYGLAQRKAIAQELASGKYRRTTLLGWLAFVALFTGFSYWRLRTWTPPQSDAEETDPAFPNLQPTPSTPHAQSAPYEPSIAWIPIAIVVGLVLAAAIAYVVSERRARRGRRSRVILAAELAAALEETLDDLRAESDARRAIVAAYARLERVLAANGVARRPAETADEYLPRVLGELEVDPTAVERLTALFTRAKFSQHEVDSAMKEEAISALEQVRDELRVARERPEPPALAAPAGAAP